MVQKVAGKSSDGAQASPSDDRKTLSVNPQEHAVYGYLFESGKDKVAKEK